MFSGHYEMGTYRVEAKIGGKLVSYDACDTRSLEEAKRDYEALGFYYIGSANGLYVNGKHQFKGKTHHFFKRVPTKLNQGEKDERKSFDSK